MKDIPITPEFSHALGVQAAVTGPEDPSVLFWVSVIGIPLALIAFAIWFFFFRKKGGSPSYHQDESGVIRPSPATAVSKSLQPNGHANGPVSGKVNSGPALPLVATVNGAVTVEVSTMSNGVKKANFITTSSTPPLTSSRPVPETALVNLRRLVIGWKVPPSIIIFGMRSDPYGVRNLAFGIAFEVIGRLLEYSLAGRLYVMEDGRIIDRPSVIKTNRVLKLQLKPDLETVTALLLIARFKKNSPEIDRLMATLKVDTKDRFLQVPVQRQTTGKNTTPDFIQIERKEFEPNGGYVWKVVSVHDSHVKGPVDAEVVPERN